MQIKNKILLWVSSLFLFIILMIFLICYKDVEYNFEKIKKTITNTIRKNDAQRFEDIRRYLSININNCSEKLYSAIENIRVKPEWRNQFLPNAFNKETNNWGTSASFLATFPHIDLINVNINEKVSSYIHFSEPYINKYIKIPYGDDIFLFCTKVGSEYKVFLGIPFWSNKLIQKYMDTNRWKSFFDGYKRSNWLLYDVQQLLNLDPSNWELKNDKLYPDLFDASISIHSKDEYHFLAKSFITMLKIYKEKLLKNKSLIELLQSKEKKHQFIITYLEKEKPAIDYQRVFCKGPLCNYADQLKKLNAAKSDFLNQNTQRNLIWKLCMTSRTGVWGFSPLGKNAPKGIVTSLLQSEKPKPKFYKDIFIGCLSKNIFLDTNVKVHRKCSFPKKDTPYQQKKPVSVSKSSSKYVGCRNSDLDIIYSKEVKQPFLTSTYFISGPRTNDQNNDSAITLGVSLDPILRNLALVSPYDVAFISKNNYIRYYQNDGSINIKNTPTINNIKVLSEQKGAITTTKGEKLYFQRIAKITDDDGYIVVVENQQSRITIINEISQLIKKTSRNIALHSSGFFIAGMMILILILSRLINNITNPIKKLAMLTKKIDQRDLSTLVIDESFSYDTEEIDLLYSSFSEMIEHMKEGIKVRGLLDKVVSKEIAEKILQGGVKVGGEVKRISVMFCDIRNFTSITEKMHPQDVLTMLNECLTLLSGVIDRFEAVIDKYEGDCIMALFGAPIETKEHALEACLCALEMQASISAWNNERSKSGLVPLEIGIGIHTGEAVAGNVGAINHQSYTVLGHVVNLCSRLCDDAAAGEILISEKTYSKVKSFIECQKNPPRMFKGLSKAIDTYSLIKKKI